MLRTIKNSAHIFSFLLPQSSRPISVTVIGWLFITVGVIGFVYHLYVVYPVVSQDIFVLKGFWTETIWIEVTEALAIVFGVFLLLGRSWARWGVLAWMAFHVGLSVYDRMHGLVVHILFLIAFAYLLFRADANEYFRTSAESR